MPVQAPATCLVLRPAASEGRRARHVVPIAESGARPASESAGRTGPTMARRSGATRETAELDQVADVGERAWIRADRHDHRQRGGYVRCGGRSLRTRRSPASRRWSSIHQERSGTASSLEACAHVRRRVHYCFSAAGGRAGPPDGASLACSLHPHLRHRASAACNGEVANDTADTHDTRRARPLIKDTPTHFPLIPDSEAKRFSHSQAPRCGDGGPRRAGDHRDCPASPWAASSARRCRRRGRLPGRDDAALAARPRLDSRRHPAEQDRRPLVPPSPACNRGRRRRTIERRPGIRARPAVLGRERRIGTQVAAAPKVGAPAVRRRSAGRRRVAVQASPRSSRRGCWCGLSGVFRSAADAPRSLPSRDAPVQRWRSVRWRGGDAVASSHHSPSAAAISSGFSRGGSSRSVTSAPPASTGPAGRRRRPPCRVRPDRDSACRWSRKSSMAFLPLSLAAAGSTI